MNKIILCITLMIVLADTATAQGKKRNVFNLPYQPSLIYYNFYNGMQMIEVSYAASWQVMRHTPEALQPKAVPWEAKHPMPASSYVFRNTEGNIIKQYLAHHENMSKASFAKPGTTKTIAHYHTGHIDEIKNEKNYHWKTSSAYASSTGPLTDCSADIHYRYKIYAASGKMGLIDTLGNIILDTLYTQITCADSIYYFSKDYKTGIMSNNFKVLFPAEHDNIRYFGKGLYIVEDYHYYGFIDKKGNPVTPVKYYGSPGEFKDGLLMVLEINSNMGNRWGFIDSTGKEVIELKYQSVQLFQNGLAIAKMNNGYGFIDKKGNAIIDFKYDYVQPFTDGLAKVKRNNKYGMINKKGEEVIPCDYTILEAFSEGLAAVSKANTGGPHIGYINTKNELVIPFMYENAWPFIQGKAKVQKDGKEMYINRHGIQVTASAR